MNQINLLLKFKSEIFWKERIITLLVTFSYLAGNIIELFTQKVAEDPIVIWVTGVGIGILVLLVSVSRFKKFTPIFFNLFIYYANFNLVYAYSKSINSGFESQSFYLLANYVLIVVSSQVLESIKEVVFFSIFETIIFSVVNYIYRDSNPLLFNALHLLVFGFIIIGNYFLSLQRIRLTQINPNSGIQFKNLTENARDVSALFNKKLEYIYVNKSVHNAFGFKAEELVGRNFLDYVNADDKRRVLNAIQELEGQPEGRKNVEYKIETRTGELIWVESIFGNFKNGQGLFANNYIFAETRNIERRKKLESELQTQLEIEALFLKYSNSLINLQRKQINGEIYKLLSEAAPKLGKSTIAVYNLTNGILRLETAWFNTIEDVPLNFLHTHIVNKQAVAEILNEFSRQDMLVYHPAESVQQEEHTLLFIKQKITISQTRLTIIPLLSNNSLIGIAVAFKKISGESEMESKATLFKLLGVMVSNALSRKNTEEKLAEVQNTNESILKALPDWLFMVNREGQFTRTNVVTNLSPYPPAENIVGQKFHDVLPEGIATKFMDALFRVIETDSIFSFEYKDTAIVVGNWFKVIVAPFRVNEYLVIIRDISELKNTQEELENKAQKLQQSNKELEEFAYVVSHDMKQPVRTVISYLNLLQKRYKDKLDDEAKEFIQIAIDGSNKMNLLILDILNYSRMDQVVEFSPNISIDSILKKVQENIGALITSSQVNIQIGKMPIVDGNETMLTELLQNLIENGIKYNRSEKKEIIVSATDKGTYWQFSFKDNGIGFEQKYADQIFKIFKRLHNDNEFTGSGIGLSICAKAVEKHGGKIWADGELGKGSIFYFTIPK